MDARRFQRAAEIFEAARQQDPDARPTFLDSACGSDGELREQVSALLAEHDSGAGLLESALRGAGPVATTYGVSPGEGPGAVIGPYKLLQEIGEGGFGVVYLAEQEQPVRRRVALKVIKPGMDSRQVIARFEAERQALAMMDHPNIAHVLDAGATETGRPFFVMELVRGWPITNFCDNQRMSVRQRLELFVQVCQAV